MSYRRYLYLWVDDIYFGVRLEDAAQCSLVVVGATLEGKKELVALSILNKLPKSQQPEAKAALHEIWMAATRQDAEEAFDHFLTVYRPKYLKAAELLEKDREAQNG